jgi:hypothetical protein
MSRSRLLVLAVTLPVLAFAAIQLVPYGRSHQAPADGQIVAFDSPRTEELARRACFDCHSNQTKWPWYSSIAPMSWRVQSHVDEGRAALNFSALDTSTEKGAEAAGESGKEIRKGKMPLQDYLLMHPEARLTAAEQAELARGLDVTFAAFVEGGEKGERGSGAAASVANRSEQGGHDDGDGRGESEDHESQEHERGERR